jgi:hypothetical protein
MYFNPCLIDETERKPSLTKSFRRVDPIIWNRLVPDLSSGIKAGVRHCTRGGGVWITAAVANKDRDVGDGGRCCVTVEQPPVRPAHPSFSNSRPKKTIFQYFSAKKVIVISIHPDCNNRGLGSEEGLGQETTAVEKALPLLKSLHILVNRIGDTKYLKIRC